MVLRRSTNFFDRRLSDDRFRPLSFNFVTPLACDSLAAGEESGQRVTFCFHPGEVGCLANETLAVSVLRFI